MLKKGKSNSERSPSSVSRAGKPGVTIIGAGRLGTALAIALNRAGYAVNLLVTKRAAHARRSAKLVGRSTLGLSAAQFHRAAQTSRIMAGSRIVIIATPDDVIGSVARDLALLLKNNQATPRVVFHTSGALSSEVLRPLKQAGMAAGSLHPLISISDSKTGAEGLRGAWFALEGDPPALRAGRRMVRGLGGRSVTIKAETKPLYHAAALMASPNLTALVDIALEMLNHSGIGGPQARDLLLPLLRSTVDNLSEQPAARALTGTFKRGDIDTIRKHLTALKAAGLADAVDAYVMLGRRSLKMANHAPALTRKIERLLTTALD